MERVYFDERIAECYGAGSAELFETDAIGPTVSPLAELAAVAFTEADGNDARAPLLTDRAVLGAPLLVLGQPVPALNHGLDWEANDPKGYRGTVGPSSGGSSLLSDSSRSCRRLKGQLERRNNVLPRCVSRRSYEVPHPDRSSSQRLVFVAGAPGLRHDRRSWTRSRRRGCASLRRQVGPQPGRTSPTQEKVSAARGGKQYNR